MKGSRMGRGPLALSLLAPWASEAEEGTGSRPASLGNGEGETHRTSQSYVRHLSKVQLLVISRGSRLALRSSALERNQPKLSNPSSAILYLGAGTKFEKPTWAQL